MKKLFLVLCIGSVSIHARTTDLVSTTTYQPYQPTIARKPITHAERMRMTYDNDMIRLQAVQDRLATLYTELADLQQAPDSGHKIEIQKTIDMLHDTIDQYEAQVEKYKRNLGIPQ